MASVATLASLIRETLAQSRGLRVCAPQIVNPSSAAHRATMVILSRPVTRVLSDLRARILMSGASYCQHNHQTRHVQTAATLVLSQRRVNVPSLLDAMTATLPRVRRADPQRVQNQDLSRNLKTDRSRVRSHAPNREMNNRSRDQNGGRSQGQNRDLSRVLSPSLSRRNRKSQSLRHVKMRPRDQRNATMIGKPDDQ